MARCCSNHGFRPRRRVATRSHRFHQRRHDSARDPSLARSSARHCPESHAAKTSQATPGDGSSPSSPRADASNTNSWRIGNGAPAGCDGAGFGGGVATGSEVGIRVGAGGGEVVGNGVGVGGSGVGVGGSGAGAAGGLGADGGGVVADAEDGGGTAPVGRGWAIVEEDGAIRAAKVGSTSCSSSASTSLRLGREGDASGGAWPRSPAQARVHIARFGGFPRT